uniref:Uncharacterized protein n=1 Tax=Pristionchus pacificus TaxID=54126 RepID=A0A2A6CXV9_PRIPA|eukprot:PDM82861.1 hypothetical protein PRIPAC_37254 [Pristionchus pacificus]
MRRVIPTPFLETTTAPRHSVNGRHITTRLRSYLVTEIRSPGTAKISGTNVNKAEPFSTSLWASIAN